MGLISFIKSAGEKIFGKSEEKREIEKSEAILQHIKKYNFKVEDLRVEFDDETVTVFGVADSKDEKNRILVTAGNIDGVSNVNDRMFVKSTQEEEEEEKKQFYTVQKGDYLSKIAKEVYGDPMKYNIIFEANKPMLKDPDKIYPGQVLFIPKLK